MTYNRVLRRIGRAANRGDHSQYFSAGALSGPIRKQLDALGYLLVWHKSEYVSVNDECGRWSSSSSFTTNGYYTVEGWR